MKGILTKDFIVTVKQCRSYFFSVIVFCFVSAICNGFGSSSFLVVFAAMMASMLPTTLISLDEKSKWDMFALALPYKRSETVISKYIEALIGNFACAVLYLLAYTVFNFKQLDFSYAVPVALLAVAAGFIYTAVTLPPIFKLGVEKGRVWYMAGIILISGVFGGLMGMSDGSLQMKMITGEFNILGAALTALAAAFVIFILSALLSVRFYEKRDIN